METSVHIGIQRRLLNVVAVRHQILDAHHPEVLQLVKEKRNAFNTRSMEHAIETIVRTSTWTLQRLPKGKPKAKAKAEAKGKAEAKTKPQGKAKAHPTAPAIRLCRAWNPLAPAIQKRINTYDDDVSECSSLDSDADSDCSTDDEPAMKTVSIKERDRGTSSTTPKAKKRVLFAADVRFQSSKPRRSYKDRGDRVIKVNGRRATLPE